MKTPESIESPISPVFCQKKKKKNLWKKNKKLAILQLERERFKCKWELRVTLESEGVSFRACQSLSHHTWLTRIQGGSWLLRNACEEWGERAGKGERWMPFTSVCRKVSPVGLHWQSTLTAISVFRGCARFGPTFYWYENSFPKGLLENLPVLWLPKANLPAMCSPPWELCVLGYTGDVRYRARHMG